MHNVLLQYVLNIQLLYCYNFNNWREKGIVGRKRKERTRVRERGVLGDCQISLTW